MLSALANIFLPGSAALSEAQKKAQMNRLIDEIHHSFYTEMDTMLAGLKLHRVDTSKGDYLERKAKRLIEQGFGNAKEVAEYRHQRSIERKLEDENREKQQKIDCINYFKYKYPSYKFITEEGVMKLCQKYNLIYGSVSQYTGTVPDSNLTHIEQFKIAEEDKAFEFKMNPMLFLTQFYGYRYMVKDNNIMSGRQIIAYRTLFQECDFVTYIKQNHGYDETHVDHMKKLLGYQDLSLLEIQYQLFKQRGGIDYDIIQSYKPMPMEIVAPAKDFIIDKKMEVKNFKITPIEVKDPIVLEPVFYDGTKHYLIVTAWGQEASDDLVMNPVHN